MQLRLTLQDRVGNNCPGAPGFFGSDKDKVLALAIACAVVLAVSLSFRLVTAINQIWQGRRDLQDWNDWLHVFTGLIVTLMDPWNGSLVSHTRQAWFIKFINGQRSNPCG